MNDHNLPPFFEATDVREDSANPAQSGHERQKPGLSDTNQLFEAYLARAPAEHAAALARSDAERRAEAERSSSSRAKLAGLLSSALGRFGGELPPPPMPPEPAAVARARKAVQSAPTGRVSVAELAATLNEHTDARIASHVTRAREHVADEDASDPSCHAPSESKLAKLAPHRRERPTSKEDTPRTHLHREARVMASAIVNSRGSFVIQAYLYKLRQIFSGQPLSALRAAALQPITGSAWCRYTYADECARRRIAAGLMFLVCGKWTSQRVAFGSRSTRRGLVISGMSVDRILRAVTPVGRKPYDRHVFSRRTNKQHTWTGDMDCFERAGFAVRKRLPAARCNRWEVGPIGKSKNRYWIGCVVSSREQKRERRNRRAPMTCFADALAAVVLDPSAHAVGWDWADERPEYAPRAGAPPPF